MRLYGVVHLLVGTILVASVGLSEDKGGQFTAVSPSGGQLLPEASFHSLYALRDKNVKMSLLSAMARAVKGDRERSGRFIANCVEFIKNESSTEVTSQGVSVIADVGGDMAWPALASLLQHRHAEVRQMVRFEIQKRPREALLTLPFLVSSALLEGTEFDPNMCAIASMAPEGLWFLDAFTKRLEDTDTQEARDLSRKIKLWIERARRPGGILAHERK